MSLPAREAFTLTTHLNLHTRTWAEALGDQAGNPMRQTVF